MTSTEQYPSDQTSHLDPIVESLAYERARADLFPPDDSARFAGTELETSAERAARTMTPDHISIHDHIRVVAYQAERYARFAEQTARTIAQHEVSRATAERQAVEDMRANRRNRNRALTLLVALVLGFTTPTLCKMFGIPLAYAFCVVIVPDAFITFYALVRKY